MDTTPRQQHPQRPTEGFIPLERFVSGKQGISESAMENCEDGIVVGRHFAAVIDGSTSKGTIRFGGKTTGRTAMELLADAISHRLAPEAEMAQAVGLLTACIRRFYETNHLLHHVARHAEKRLTASAAIFSARRREVWLVGDCACRLNGKTVTNPKKVDAVLARTRADILRHLLDRGHSVAALQARDLGREWILPFLKDQCAFQNATDAGPFAYTVLDGFEADTGRIKVVPVPPHTKELILATDGYPVLCDTLQDTERALARLLQEDPLCIHARPATKGLAAGNCSFDDRSYLRILLATPRCTNAPEACGMAGAQ